ncbi:MAG: YggT family protein [bacterium]
MLVIFVWIISSWFPQARYNAIVDFCGRLSEPFLKIFRSAIPPLGGMLDVSPILAFIVLQLIARILIQAPF